MCSTIKGSDQLNTRINNIENYNIAVIVPGNPIGGVKRTVDKLVKGLNLEGFHVKPIELHGNILSVTFSDIKNISVLRGFDAIIYMGSIPLPSHVYINNYVKTILFIHGFVVDELLNVIKHEKLRVKIRGGYMLGLWSFSRTIRRIDMFICRCLTSCEVNGIHENFILLPEFVFLDELENYEKLVKELREDKYDDIKIRILTYTSYAESPRLLKPQHIEHLIKCVSRRVGKEIELTIIDPRGGETTKLTGNLTVRYLKPLPKEIFYRYITNADLFIELCIDEELRNTSIEVALLGTPIAKITHPRYRDRLDYRKDIMIHAFSFKDLINEIVNYVSNVEHYRSYYSKRLQEFISTHRTWDAIKDPLVRYIKNNIE